MQKILIVEDDIDIQDILKNHLIDAGYEVVLPRHFLWRGSSVQGAVQGCVEQRLLCQLHLHDAQARLHRQL